ncbi:hypothetical protein LPTSP3_g12170 [Leptospira kobayashii]|uniref:Lipoprotein n=1 Tax=Leptospira kobayashii TaxID=1917830 RepID=A0ABM7UI26_9LEPT|nr:hypothetical protein [Leptospira kobayashii]BDA78287.1 hypothetical protein LPTSP3_g12170 [Leptospira kobayashii]
MNPVLKFFILLSLVFFSFACKEREDKTIEKNLLLYTLTCNGGSLGACQSQCAAAYPSVTGDNFPSVSTCQSNCTTNCNLSNTLLLLLSKR